MGKEIEPVQVRKERSVTLFDKNDPGSLINLLPEKFAQRFDEVGFEFQELFEMDETDLYKFLKNHNKQPTAVDNRLRLKFWMEYDRVVDHQGKEKMNISNMVAGVCTRDYFYKAYLSNESKIAWLLCPPTGYMTKAMEGFEFGLDQMREILDMPVEHMGKRDHKLMALKVQITKMLGDRAKGAVAQNINQKTVSVNVNATPGEVAAMGENLSMEEIDKRLAQLKRMDAQESGSKSPYVTPNQSREDAIEVEVKHVSDHQ